MSKKYFLPVLALSLLSGVCDAELTSAKATDNITTGSVFHAALPQSNISPIRGSLKEGLDALTSKNTQKALAIGAGMPEGSLERKVLTWAMVLSPSAMLAASDIVQMSNDLQNWPGHKAMSRNFETALLRTKPDHQEIIDNLGGRMPQTDEAVHALALAYMNTGQTDRAANIIRPIYHTKRMTNAQQNDFIKKFGPILRQADHKRRMDQQLYNDRAKSALAISTFAKAESLAKGRAAVIRREAGAADALRNVHQNWKNDPSFLFSQIQYLRRAERYNEAAKLLLSAPKNPQILVDPDEWWVERRLISRALRERGDAQTAYQLAAGHSAKSAKSKVDAEFHAGWYALRFLNAPNDAFIHFANILQHSNQPLSVSRAYYWLGRTQDAVGAPGAAKQFYKEAARFGGTFYGQLALTELGSKAIPIRRQKASKQDRENFAANPFVRTIGLLEANGYSWRADILYRHLARNLQNAGELAILAHQAEKRGDHNLSLQIGKIAYARGLPADNLAFPLGAIPKSAKVTSSGLALSYAIARQESAFRTDAVSGAGALGLLQLLPSTAKAVAKRHGFSYTKAALTSNPALNASLGAAYLSEQKAKFGGSYILTFAAYNAGPRRAEQWVARFGNPSGKSLHEVIDWIEMIPFTETRNYVMRVMENYQVYKARIQGAPLQISSDLRK